MNQLFEPAILIGILTGAIRFATPYLYASIGEMFAQRSGVVNLGVDGIMLMGAFSGFFVALNLTADDGRWRSVAGPVGGGDRRHLDGPADVGGQRHVESGAGHQRHRPVHFWAGPIQPVVPRHGRHGADDRRF